MDPLADLQALARAPRDVARDLRAIADAVRILPEIEAAIRPLPEIVEAVRTLPEITEAVRTLPEITEAVGRLPEVVEAVRAVPALEALMISLLAALEPMQADVHELCGIVASQQQQVTHIEEMLQRVDRRTVVLERAVLDLERKADQAMQALPDPDDDNRTVLEKAKEAITGT